MNYKTVYLTTLCLQLLNKHIDLADVEVIVVDNGSNDESLEYLRSLDWIQLVERTQNAVEPAFISHGKALDAGFEQVKTPYVCLLHTDTLIHDPLVFGLLLEQVRQSNVAAAGSYSQRHRKIHSRWYRTSRKFLRHYLQRGRLTLGLSKRPAKPYRDHYLKSFCSMWDVELIRESKLKFSTQDKNPGYDIQDKLRSKGFRFVNINTKRLFQYLDHVQSGTTVEMGRTKKNRRRKLEYEKIVNDARVGKLGSE